MAGIRVDGENHFMIAPVPGGTLTYARGWYQSIYGTVESYWKKTEKGIEFTITIPANTKAKVRLPDGTLHSMKAGTKRFTI